MKVALDIRKDDTFNLRLRYKVIKPKVKPQEEDKTFYTLLSAEFDKQQEKEK